MTPPLMLNSLLEINSTSALTNFSRCFAGVCLRGSFSFRLVFEAPNDPSLVHVVWRHLHLHTVAHSKAHPPFAHLAGNSSQNKMLVVQLHTEHRPGQDGLNVAFDFD